MRAPARLAVVVRAGLVAGVLAKHRSGASGGGGGAVPGWGATGGGGGGPAGGGDVLLAAKGPTHSSKILVYSVGAGPGGASVSAQPAHLLARVTLPEPVLDVVWVRDGILVAVPGGYQLVQSGCKVIDVAPGVTTRTMLAACPPIKQALMLFADMMLLLVDSMGAAVREPFLLLDRPVAIALTPAFVVAVTDDAILVYDSVTTQQVQQLPYAHDDAWVAASGRLPCAEDTRTGALLLATSSAVMCLQPVEVEQQVWELLKAHRYPQATALARSALASGAPWAGPAMAQAGLLLLHSMRVREAMEALEACPLEAWQPAQLLPLFPSAMARWLAEAPAPRPYWGLHGPGPLQSLLHICNHHLDVQKARLQHHVRQQQPSPQQLQLGAEAALIAEAKAHIASYILTVRGRPGVACLEALDTLSVVLMSEAGQAGALETFLASGPAAAAAAAAAALGAENGSSWLPPSPRLPLASHSSAAWGAPEGTLNSQRSPAGISNGGAASGTGGQAGLGRAAAAAAPPCQAALRESVQALEQGGRWHALALLRAARNHLDEALALWEGLAQGTLQESAAPSGAVAAAACVAHSAVGRLDRVGAATPSASAAQCAVAVASAAAVLRDARLAPTSLVLRSLPWLLARGPRRALLLLRQRDDVAVESALALLVGHTGDVRWEYLQHLVYGRGMQDGALHTELALELVECIQRENQHLEEQPQQLNGREGHGPGLSDNSGGRFSEAAEKEQFGEPGLRAGFGDEDAGSTAVAESSRGSKPTGPSQDGGNLGWLADMSACLATLEAHCRRQQLRRQQQHEAAASGAAATSSSSQQEMPRRRDTGQRGPGPGGGGGGGVGPSPGGLPSLHSVASAVGLAALDVVPLLLAAVHHPDEAGNGAGMASGGSGFPLPLLALVPRLLRLRAALLLHLHESEFYDPRVVLAALGPLPEAPQPSEALTASAAPAVAAAAEASTSGLPAEHDPDRGGGRLLRERVQLLSRLAAHGDALRLLAFEMHDIDACIAYCRRQARRRGSGATPAPPAPAAAEAQQPDASWLVLLELLLNPGAGRQPLYSASVRVLHEEGGSLSPLQVLAALPDAMPLHLASETLSGMLAGVTHRRRQTQVVRGLQRACNLSCRAEMAELSGRRVVVGEDSACHGCHRLLLDKVVYGYPSGALLCARCAKPPGSEQ